MFQNALAALLPAGALFFAVSEYLLPIYYRLTDNEVQARCGLTLLEMPWRDVRHVYLTDDALKISPLKAKNSRFEAWRGIWLRFGSEDREHVIDTVRRLRDTAQAKLVSAETEAVKV